MKRNRKKLPNREQMAIMRAHGMNPAVWEVIQDLPGSLLVRNWVLGDFKLIGKGDQNEEMESKTPRRENPLV